MTLGHGIDQWDGKSATQIAALYARHCDQRDFIDQLTTLMAQADRQAGATWLLKHHLENGHALSASARRQFFTTLPALTGWAARLHALQCLPHLTIPARQKTVVESFLRHCLMAENKFVRAWAYGGFMALAGQYPEYREEAEQFVAMAMRDEAPSVKARLRQVLKQAR